MCIRNLTLLVIVAVVLAAAQLVGDRSSKTVAASSRATAANCYTITKLGTLGGVTSFAYGVNDYGHVVGLSYTPDNGGQWYYHAFLYRNGTVQDLGTLGGPLSVAYSINNSEQIAGEAMDPQGFRHGFRFQNGTMQDLGTLVANGLSSGHDINSNGAVVGSALASDGRNHAFIYQGGSMQDLGLMTFGRSASANGVDGNGNVVGLLDFVFPGGIFASHAFLFDGTMHDLGALGGSYSEATAINNTGQVVGWSEKNIGAGIWNHAFLYENGVMQDLGTLGQQHSKAFDINGDGDVVGIIYSTNLTHPFIYRNGTMQDLNDLLPQNSGWELTEARSISNSGNIVGIGILDGFLYTQAFLMSPCGATNTDPGTGVVVQSRAGDAKVSFAQVTGAGNTTFTAIDPNAVGIPPSGFSFCPTCPAYEITTTATYGPPITVCLTVPAAVDPPTFDALTLRHVENGAWADITTSRITNLDGTREVCGNVSSLSPFGLGSPPPPLPEAPSNLTAGAVSASQINLSWNDNSSNEMGFIVERCSEKGKCRNFNEIGQVGTGIRTFSDTGLAASTAYSYRVRAYNGGGASAYTNTVKERTPRR